MTPTGAITDRAVWDVLPEESQVHLVNHLGAIWTYPKRHALSEIELATWNIGARDPMWIYDFAFTNYWFAYAHSLKRKQANAKQQNTADRAAALDRQLADL